METLRAEPHFLAVLGPSGCGKSSVVQAGLIPKLRRGAVPDSDHWKIIIIRPSDTSFNSLLTALGQAQQHVALVIDQFEELYLTSPESASQREDNLTSLIGLLESASHITIIIVLRDDFYSHFVRHERLAQWLKHGLVNVSPQLTRSELTAIVREPLKAVGMVFEDGLIEMMVKDAIRNISLPEDLRHIGRSTILPLLEFTLTQLWERREEGKLTRTAYERIGGVTGGLARWADEVFSTFKREQRPLVQRIFIDLIHLGDGEQHIPDSRRRRLLTSLSRRKDEQETVSQIVQRLTSARLLITSRGGQNHLETVEIIHEALLYEWSELRRWLTDDRLFLAWHQGLEQRTRAWIDTDVAEVSRRDEGRLLRGRELVEAENWMNERGTDMSDEEQGFIQTSRERQASEEAHWQELYEEAERQRQIAEERRQVSLAHQLVAQAELMQNQRSDLTQRSILLAVEAMRRSPSPQADQTLRHGLALLPRHIKHLSHGDIIYAVAFSPDGRYLATANGDGTTLIWEVSSCSQLYCFPHTSGVHALAFSPNGQYLATCSSAACVWDISDGSQLACFNHTRNVNAVAFSPDGYHLATASFDGTAGVWEVASRRQVAKLTHEGEVWDIAFSPDGDYLATASLDGTARVWKTSNYNQVLCITHEDPLVPTLTSEFLWPLFAVLFSPDGSRFATAGEDHTVRVWQTTDGTLVARLWQTDMGYVVHLTHQNDITSMVFSSNGHYLATASDDRTAIVWEVSNGRQVAHLKHEDRINAVAFSKDERYLVTASNDNTAGVWEIVSGRCLTRLLHENEVHATAFSPDGYHLVTAGWDMIKIWDVNNEGQLARFIHERYVDAVAFSSDGAYLAVASLEYTSVWEMHSGRQILRLTSNNRVKKVTFSPNVSYLALVSERLRRDDTVELWEIASGRQIATLSTTSRVYAIAFSTDEHYLFTAGEDSILSTWDIIRSTRVTHLTHERAPLAAAFSAGGKYLATANENHSVIVWTASNGLQIAGLNLASSIDALAISPNASCLAVANNDRRTVELWEVAINRLISRFPHERQVHDITFSPDGRYLATASGGELVEYSYSKGYEDGHGYTYVNSVSGNVAGVWEVETGSQLVHLVHNETVNAVAFSNDGRYLATTSSDGIARVWFWQSDDLIAEARARLDRNLTPEEWQQYIGDEAYHKTFPDLP